MVWTLVGRCTGTIAPTGSPTFDQATVTGCPDDWVKGTTYEEGDLAAVTVSSTPLRKIAYKCKTWPFSGHCSMYSPAEFGGDLGWTKVGGLTGRAAFRTWRATSFALLPTCTLARGGRSTSIATQQLTSRRRTQEAFGSSPGLRAELVLHPVRRMVQIMLYSSMHHSAGRPRSAVARKRDVIKSGDDLSDDRAGSEPTPNPGSGAPGRLGPT
ncbi:hypothetical protein THAOC_28757, partial [Thalassiosira oceanica]